MDWPASLHLIGSKGLGGAERWFQRFAAALAERHAPATLGIRASSALAGLDLGPLPVRSLPFRSTWDPISRLAVTRLLRATDAPIVQTYMGRATRLTHTRGRAVHIARLGGYYRLGPYRHADAWIGNTRGLCDWMITNGLPAARVHHIYNFVEPALPRPAARITALRTRLGIAAEEQVLVCLGRLVPVKGHQVLLDALARLPVEIAGRRWRVVLVGDGPLRGALERQASGSGIAGRIVWAGWQDDPGQFLQLADLVVFPSLDAETLGNVILEAWAWERPLVTANFRGAREIAHHGEDAWCVPCEDAPALAQGIRTLLADPALCADLVRNGHERVRARFGADPIMEQYRTLYRDLLAG